ncbi:enoyl-CoA hydratase/isomerase family protein [Robiginitalea aurantiaca]|uniref:Enoyl-CoA hydratase/isomerase family protein n=1 Tax=Robiginitalea aurantiaca TaxID=3056915 RepID=A0ABT7WDY1_9FLAO|nr:enoyl-CoA hydratase/isomerase family protein [Robiginitalea aurantiaca]MDM9631122.1 enoyl-CoA hydratase/isomerase family protein [Robiginitalea aurantiaca]
MNTITRIDKSEYTILQLNRGKVNAINHEMVMELRQVFQDLENDPEVRGAILTGQPHFFSAGLDLIELIRYDKKQISSFFEDFGALYLQLVRFPKPFISAITGHAPAGGCVLAVTSDNRIMAEGDKYVIGLNEVAVNIQISQNLTEAYAFWMGDGLASRYILEGKLLSGAEAHASGLVDELLPLEYVLERAEAKMKTYLKADPEIWVSTKKKVRKHWLDRLDTDASQSLKEAATLWWKPEIRQKMEAYVNSFSTKKSQ